MINGGLDQSNEDSENSGDDDNDNDNYMKFCFHQHNDGICASPSSSRRLKFNFLVC